MGKKSGNRGSVPGRGVARHRQHIEMRVRRQRLLQGGMESLRRAPLDPVVQQQRRDSRRASREGIDICLRRKEREFRPEWREDPHRGDSGYHGERAIADENL